MQVIIEKNYQDMSKKAAELVASQIIFKPASVLGFATGSTPLGMYEELIYLYQKGYHYYMMNNFFNKINIQKSNIHLLNGMTDDVEKECSKYDKAIEKNGGIDLQILGIGPNGHIGFNEPEKKLHARTHLVKLSQETIEANSRFFSDKTKVPDKAISVGMATILKAEKIILLASGKNKAEAVKNTVNGFVDTMIPASFLQTHPCITMIIDEEAAILLD